MIKIKIKINNKVESFSSEKNELVKESICNTFYLFFIIIIIFFFAYIYM
jgi:hypothetical protein